MMLGYNTNGFAHHSLAQCFQILAELGYQSVALTLDHGSLNPYSHLRTTEEQDVRSLLSAYGLACTVETGARYLLDARRKHQPTLLSPDPSARQIRRQFIQHAIDTAHAIGSGCVSLWSGSLDPVEESLGTETIDSQMSRLADELRSLVHYGEQQGVVLGFEPEPGMLIDTMAKWERLLAEGGLDWLMLTLDVGHLHCQGEFPVEAAISRYGKRIVNIHIEDMRQGVHEHLMFGEGEMDFPPLFAALHQIQYRGPVHVELSRHSHMAPVAAHQAWNFLAPLVGGVQKR